MFLTSSCSICAVHGLNGNAFDTWVAKTNDKMWLRDLLPTSKPFDKSRIMTFGYSSQLSDRSDLSGMSEWAHHLLTAMSSVRQTPEVGTYSQRIHNVSKVRQPLSISRSNADLLSSYAILWVVLLRDRYSNLSSWTTVPIQKICD